MWALNVRVFLIFLKINKFAFSSGLLLLLLLLLILFINIFFFFFGAVDERKLCLFQSLNLALIF